MILQIVDAPFCLVLIKRRQTVLCVGSHSVWGRVMPGRYKPSQLPSSVGQESEKQLMTGLRVGNAKARATRFDGVCYVASTLTKTQDPKFTQTTKKTGNCLAKSLCGFISENGLNCIKINKHSGFCLFIHCFFYLQVF